MAHGGPAAEGDSHAAAAATAGGSGVDRFPADHDFADAIASRTAGGDDATARVYASAGAGGLFAGGYGTAGDGAEAGAARTAGGDDKRSQPREELSRKALRGGARQDGVVEGWETQDRILANVFEGRMGESFDVRDEGSAAGAIDEVRSISVVVVVVVGCGCSPR